MEYIKSRASHIEPLEEFDKLHKDNPLRIKLGIDPTASDVTLGWYAILRMLRKFQELGHTAVLILGDFTAQVGDPSGKSDTRLRIEQSDVDKYSKDVLNVIKDILLPDNLEIVSNNDWLSKLTTSELMNLASSTTLAQMMEREDFSSRYSNNSPISLLEFFYPLFQGYDSVAVKSDIEIGGTDQLWNLMMGREIQKYYDIKPQVAITFPLLIGTDGVKKMSQSFNNYISIKDTPESIFGNLMSIPDVAMWEYYILLTDLSIEEIDELKHAVDNNSSNPFEIKKDLGKIIIKELFNEDEANKAFDSFSNITIDKKIPDKMVTITIPETDKVHLPQLFVDNNITKSTSEARRLIQSQSVKINDKVVDTFDFKVIDMKNKHLQIGKRRFFKIK